MRARGLTVKVLVALAALLTVVAGAQTYYLVRMHHQLHQTMAAASSDPTKLDPGANANSQQGWSFHFGPDSTGAGHPADQWFSVPFGPNMTDPFKEMEEMHKRMDRLFEQAFGRPNIGPSATSHGGHFGQGLFAGPQSSVAPQVTDDGSQYVVRMQVPGADSSKIKATVKDGVLTISGAREEGIQHVGSPAGSPRQVSEFETTLTLPGPVKEDQVEAHYDNGVLTITIPKDTAKRPDTLLIP